PGRSPRPLREDWQSEESVSRGPSASARDRPGVGRGTLLNLHRRHLDASQRGMAGARARELYDKRAKERMSEGGKAAGKGRPKQGKENLPDPIPSSGQARDQAAAAAIRKETRGSGMGALRARLRTAASSRTPGSTTLGAC